METVERDALEHHVFGLRRLALATHQAERSVRHSQEPTVARVAPGRVARLVEHAEVGGHAAVDRTLKFGNPGAHRRPASGRIGVLLAGHRLHGIVRATGAHNGADGNESLHHRGDSRKQFANLDAGNRGLDGPQLAANLRRRIDFDVPHILMGRPARQEDIDDRLMRATDALL